MDVFVARQPVFDRSRDIYGYELLYRSERAPDQFDGTEAATATKQVVSGTVMSIGLDNILGGKRAFVNFDHPLLKEKVYLNLPREATVIEILESVAPTPELIALCRRVREQGYTIALDDFVFSPELEPLTDLAHLIKIDVRTTTRAEQERLLQRYRSRGIAMLAEKVETQEEFEWSKKAGYDYFQGYFFARPNVIRSQQVPASKVLCLRLLSEVQKPDLNFKSMEKLIRSDLSLTYKLLRYVNSALFARRERVQSIEHALVVAGSDNLRRWAALATLPKLAMDKPGELVTLSICRARFCENLIRLAGHKREDQAFLMGMFSLLDALLDQPLEDALSSVGVSADVTHALLGTGAEANNLSPIYELARHYEAGNWDEVETLAGLCGFPATSAAEAYVEASKWAQGMLQGALV